MSEVKKTKDHDSVMSDVINEDMCGQEAGGFLAARKDSANASGGGSSPQDSRGRTGNLETWHRDRSKVDVLMTDAGVEKPQFPSHKKKLESIDPPSIMKSSPPRKASEKQYASDPRKMEKIHDFDHGQNTEPSKV